MYFSLLATVVLLCGSGSAYVVSSHTFPGANILPARDLIRRQLESNSSVSSAAGSAIGVTSSATRTTASAAISTQTGRSGNSSTSTGSTSGIRGISGTSVSAAASSACSKPQTTSTFQNGEDVVACQHYKLAEALSTATQAKKCLPANGGDQCNDLLRTGLSCATQSATPAIDACFCDAAYFTAWKKCVACAGLSSFNQPFIDGCGQMGHTLTLDTTSTAKRSAVVQASTLIAFVIGGIALGALAI